jgi:uncharacterized protein YegP (UPF0339 family)
MKFEIFTDTGGGFRFRLLSKNGEVVAQSEAYTTKDKCKKGIAAVKRCARAKVSDLTH